MMDKEDAWIYYYNDVSEKVNLGLVMKTPDSVCSALGLTLGHSWKAYLTELPNFPWTNIYLTSLELKESDRDIKSRILHALYYGPNGKSVKDFASSGIHVDESREDKNINIDPVKVQCLEAVVRKEGPMDIEYVINELQNKLCF